MKGAVKSYFTRRGLIISDGNDFADALYWSGRFLELIAGKSLDVSVLELKGQDEQGRKVLIPASAYRKKLHNLKRLPVATFLVPENFEELAA